MEQGDEQPATPALDDGPRRHGLHWALGILGRILITLGLLIIAFVGYQLWGTGIQFRANQAKAADEFEATRSSLLAATPTTAPPTTAPPTTVPPVTTVAGPTTSATATTTSTSTTTTTTPGPTLPPIALGDSVGELRMPSIKGKPLYIVAGVRVDDLQHGIGHFPSTPLPGEFGNAAIAGHRTTWGAPFEDLDDLEPGDRLIVDTLLGGHYEYVVTSSLIINPSDTWVLDQPTDPTISTLTLTTCHPKRSTKQRWVVFSTLDPAASSAPEPHTANYKPTATTGPSTSLAAPVSTTPEVLPGEGVDSTSVATTVASPATAPATSVAPATVAPATTAAVVLPGDDVDEQDADAFGRGWFHDGAAWPHVLFWGGLLAGIAYLAWLLGKRTGHGWLAYVAGFAPFIIVLYFFFENVNRLLPPGL